MLEKIEVWKEYLDGDKDKVKSIFAGDNVIVYIVNGKEYSCDKDFALRYWSEISVKKKPTKFLAYIDGCGELRIQKEGAAPNSIWRRVPSKDFEAIVEV